MIHAPTRCGGIFTVVYTENHIPYLICGNCQHEIRDWIKWQEEYSLYWKDPARYDKTNAPVVVLGYFTSKYKEHYDIDYAMSLDAGGLFKSAEILFTRRLLSNFGGNIKTTQAYIDWIFKEKVVLRKKKITSMSFMTAADLLNQYRFVQKKALTINRDTLLPPQMLAWIKHKAPALLDMAALNDFGDLQILLNSIRNGHLDKTEDVSMFTQKLSDAKIIDAELNLLNWSE